MPDFLIHRDEEGQIVRAIPYENIMMINIEQDINDSITVECGGWQFYFTLQNMDGGMIDCTKADADRYLSEWREWWERKEETITDKPLPLVYGRIYSVLVQGQVTHLDYFKMASAVHDGQKLHIIFEEVEATNENSHK